ncbi:MAG: ATP-binding cassette domain-containing protein [Ruthenibacterium sp.]
MDVVRYTVVLKADALNNKKLKDISFELYKGEILGFYGLVGAGKTEIARALFGADVYEGSIAVNGKVIDITSPQKAIENGLVLVPEERRTQGICTSLSIATNTPMMNYNTVSKNGITNKAKIGQLARDYIAKIGTACRDENQSVAYLSGGNQQKVVLSKCLNASPKILLLDEPTRGVDVGAKQEIYGIIRQMVKEGYSAIVLSSELPEILGLCDRIGLLYEGEIKTFMNNDENVKTQSIMSVVTGGEEL